MTKAGGNVTKTRTRINVGNYHGNVTSLLGNIFGNGNSDATEICITINVSNRNSDVTKIWNTKKVR